MSFKVFITFIDSKGTLLRGGAQNTQLYGGPKEEYSVDSHKGNITTVWGPKGGYYYCKG